MLFNRYLIAAAALALLSACSSTETVDPQAGAGTATTMPGDTAGSGVASVQADTSAMDAAGPAGVPTVVYFDFDSFVVKPEYQSVIDGHARYLQAHRGRQVTLEGHTDERGGREYNLALGQKRAEAVRRALGVNGVSDAQAEPVSFGEEKPAVAGTGESAWSQNRRVEIKYR
ncbi:MAG: peptidoglycan-associated lipoprotein Pal [Ottowia sp.]